MYYIFSKQEEGKTFISIMPHGLTTRKLAKCLKFVIEDIPIYHITRKEILIDVERNGKPCCNFSLQQLCKIVRSFTDATISMFNVDLEETGQRAMYDLNH